MTRNIRLKIQFDGTDFFGWQIQKSDRTPQGVLTEKLMLLTGHKITLYGSSRTDSGVHAIEMVANFKTDTTLPMVAFHLGLNSMLPPDVRVTGADEVPDRFNARFTSTGKTYVYRIQTGETRLPLKARNSWHVRHELDIDAMKMAAALMTGKHNFNAFRSVHCDAANPVRTVELLTVKQIDEDIISITIEARSFLRNMVRIIAGSLVAIGRGKQKPEWVLELFESGDRALAGVTAPPQGLFLKKVHYPDEFMTPFCHD